MNYHNDIMNIQVSLVNMDGAVGRYRSHGKEDLLYKEGHRDARHEAAEIALNAEAEIQDLKEQIKDYKHLVSFIATERTCPHCGKPMVDRYICPHCSKDPEDEV